ncbi:hypothetical protein [Paenibacillus abyssi]|uniref:Uncharacterized protein n=1 Tax=Paenibacillus abyssi TaxID=1340531 RepID=A0A917G1F1_9BACL|nr:hypothetical protein [Paenibacillus abyssi]GGG18076.1 hypothetical protein GCM10010916_38590 [Paenibacillus abyssi]
MASPDKRMVLPSCSLCSRFDSLRGICGITGEKREVFDTETALVCQREGRFIRDINAVPNSFNFYGPNEEIPNFLPDLSRIPVDAGGRPLIVKTNRGLERAVPAYEGLALRVDPVFGEVPSIYTYQGQRELIFRLGVHLAKRVAEREGVELVVHPDEEGSEGRPEAINDFMEEERIRENVRNRSKKGWDW